MRAIVVLHKGVDLFNQILDAAERAAANGIQGLDLALFVNAEHQRVVGRVQIQAYHVANLLDEERIGREFEAARAMRLQRKGLEQAVHGRFVLAPV